MKYKQKNDRFVLVYEKMSLSNASNSKYINFLHNSQRLVNCFIKASFADTNNAQESID